MNAYGSMQYNFSKLPLNLDAREDEYAWNANYSQSNAGEASAVMIMGIKILPCKWVNQMMRNVKKQGGGQELAACSVDLTGYFTSSCFPSPSAVVVALMLGVPVVHVNVVALYFVHLSSSDSLDTLLCSPSL